MTHRHSHSSKTFKKKKKKKAQLHTDFSLASNLGYNLGYSTLQTKLFFPVPTTLR